MDAPGVETSLAQAKERLDKLEAQVRTLIGARTRMQEKISALREKNRRLRDALGVDPKTEALNSVAFTRALRRAINNPSPMPEDMDPQGKGTLLIYIDLVNFKGFNAEYGQRGGDAALRHVVRVLLNRVRVEDVVGRRKVGRVGGDEFCALFQHITENEAHALADRLNTVFMDATIRLAPRRGSRATANVSVRVHIGAVWWPKSHRPSTKVVIDQGDDLMWACKDANDGEVAWRTLPLSPTTA